MANVNEPNGKPKVDPKIEKLNQIANARLEKDLPKAISVYNMGKAKDFSAKQANLAKYATYGSETYGKLGFDPYKAGGVPGKKSGMDALYDENTSWTADINRAWKGMWELAGIGFQDTVGLGAFADSGNYLDFEETMSKYSSSRGGNTGFWSNTMLSSGYTVGIIGGIAAEEIALAGITAATGGTAAPGTALAGATLLTRGVARIKEAGNMLKFVNKLQDVKTASGFMGKLGASTKGFVQALNPLENTWDFIKGADKLADINGWKQAALGAGSIVRDARKITMSHSESKLEADLAQKEFKQKMYDDWYKDNPGSAGEPIPDSYINKVENQSQALYNDIYKANFGLIYVTNAITFDNMLKTMKGTNKFFSNATDLFKVVKKDGGKVAVEAMKKNVWNYGRKKVGELSWKGTLKSMIGSSMEGIQELGQDMISESNKSYYARNVKGTQLRGGFMTYLEKDLKEAAMKPFVNLNSDGSIKRDENGNIMWSGEGLSTFLSGAMMGVFASPVGVATQGTQQFLFDGGIGQTAKYFTAEGRESIKQEKIDAIERRKEKAKVLTKFFNDNKNFTQAWSKPVYAASELQEQILEAGERGDQKTMKNKQHESLVSGVHNLLQTGMEEEFAKHLDYLGKNLDPQQLNEIFGRTDITEQNKSKYQKQLKDQASTVRNLRGVYDEINNTINNPINIRTLDRNDPEFMDKFFKYQAIENLKKELLFSHAKIADRANRQDGLRKEINKENPLTTLEVSALLDNNSLEQQIQLLKTEVETNSKLTISGDTAVENQATARKKLKAYQNYQEKLKAYQAEQQKEDGSISESDTFDDLFDAYNEILEVSGKNKLISPQAQRAYNRQQFNKIFDYLALGEENEFYQQFVDTVLNPEGSSSFIQGQEEMLKRLEENKEDHILTALYEFDKKAVSDEMLNELYDNDLFFDLQEIDDLVNQGIMPRQIFDVTNNKEATPEQYAKAQEIIGSYIKKLTGKTITNDKTKLNKQGRKLKSDKRTVATILNKYKVKLNTPIKLSSKEGMRLMDKLMAVDNKFMTSMDREILAKLGQQDVTIKFVSDNTLPVQLTEDGVLELDIRFTGKDYLNSVMSFENLVVTGLTQHAITEKLKTNDDMYMAARSAMEQAKKEFQRKYPSTNVEELPVFNDVNIFMTEAMNDLQFQKFLAGVEDNVQPASKSLWSTLSDGIGELIEEDFDKKLANRVINIAAKALDDTIVDNVAETQQDSKEVREQRDAAQKEKAEELTKLAKELGQRWNVNVKVVNSQEEAEDLMSKINPMMQVEDEKITGFYDEKTNTAYIVADAVKENTLYHEIFLHPFLINLEKSNPEFYKQLIAEAKANQDIIDYVTEKYGTEEEIGSRQFEHELVGRAYDLSVDNKLSERTEPGLFKKIGQFIKRMAAKVGEFLNLTKTDVSKFDPRKTTISDLANYSVNTNDKINLGKVIEADRVAQPTEQTVKPRTRKKTVQNVRTIIEEQTVNKGGDVIILDNAAERPDLFLDFLHPEIISNNNLAIAEWTQKLVELGQELDDARITKWVYGNIRAQVGGRLMIDVTAEVPVFVKKAIKSKKANPRVAELQKQITELDKKIQDLNSKKKTTSDPELEAKRAEIRQKWNNQRAWYAKNNKLAEWYAKRDNELDELNKQKTAKPSESTTTSNEVYKEFEKSMEVLMFSRNKFPGKNMPLYQHLRVLNNAIPSVGEFAYFIERDNTSNPVVKKLGTVVESNDKSFTYIDASGAKVTQKLDVKTIEFGNPYYMFSGSELSDSGTPYTEIENFIRTRRDQKLASLKKPSATAQSQELLDQKNKKEAEINELELEKASLVKSSTVQPQLVDTNATRNDIEALRKIFESEYSRPLRSTYIFKAGEELEAEAKANKKLFSKVKEVTREEKEKRGFENFVKAVQSTKDTTNTTQLNWTAYDGLYGWGIELKSDNATADLIDDDMHPDDRHTYQLTALGRTNWAEYNEGYSKEGKRVLNIRVPVITEKQDDRAGQRPSVYISFTVEMPAGFTAEQVGKPITDYFKELPKAARANTQMTGGAIQRQLERIFSEGPQAKSDETSNITSADQLKINVSSSTKNGFEDLSIEDKSIPKIDESRFLNITKTRSNDYGFVIDNGILRARVNGIDLFGRGGGGTQISVKVPAGFNSEMFANKLKNIEFTGSVTTPQATQEVLTKLRNAVFESMQPVNNEIDAKIAKAKVELNTINEQIKDSSASLFDTLDVETSLENDAIDKEIEALLKQRNALQDNLNKEDSEEIEEGEELVQEGTKTVKFLMYKSTGTGSTAESLGEWVPLIAIGKHPNGNEWFVKAYHNGQDPKFNKYGSSVFADIDRDLKAQESTLFNEPENWVTETTERQVIEEVEIEEEIPVEEQDEVQPVQDADAYRPRTEILNDLSSIQEEIKKLEAKYDQLKFELDTQKLSLIQKRKTKRNLDLLAIDINDLYNQLNDMQSEMDMADDGINLAVQDLEYVPAYDYNGNEIISYLTPWLDVPQSLRNELAELYGTPLNKLNDQDVVKIKEQLKSNPEYISIVNEYTQERLRSQDEKLGAEEAQRNRQRLEEEKLKRQQRQQDTKDQARADKKQKRLAKTKVTDEDILKSVLKDYDYSVLTPKEITQLVARFKDKSLPIRFTTEDIIAYISNKKAKVAQEEQAKKDIEEQKEISKKNAQIKSNMELLERSVIPFETSYGKKMNLRIPNNGMRKFIMTYHPEIFAMSKQEFLDEVNNILMQRSSFSKMFTVDPKLFVKGDKKIYLKIYNLVKQLEKKKQLYPDVVKKINLALYNIDSNWRIRMAGKNGPVSSMYQIKKVTSTKRITPPGVYGSAKNIIRNYELNEGNPSQLDYHVALLRQFALFGAKIQMSAVEDVFGKDSSDAKAWKSITSKDASYKTKSFDSASLTLLEGTFEDSYELGEALEDFLMSYSSLNDAIKKVSDQIKNIEKSQEGPQIDVELTPFLEQGMSVDEAVDALLTLQYLNTPEGQEMLDAEAAELDRIASSMENELINGEFDGNKDELSDPEIELLNIGETEEDVEEEILDAESFPVQETPTGPISKTQQYLNEINDLASLPFNNQKNIVIGKAWTIMETEKQSDLNYALALYKFATASKFTFNQSQINVVVDKIRRLLGNSSYYGTNILMNGKPYSVKNIVGGKVQLQNLETKAFEEFEIKDFLNSVEQVFTEGEIIPNLNVDTVVKVEEFAYIKGAYNDILNNFTSYMGEANSLSEEELLSNLREETTKCK